MPKIQEHWNELQTVTAAAEVAVKTAETQIATIIQARETNHQSSANPGFFPGPTGVATEKLIELSQVCRKASEAIATVQQQVNELQPAASISLSLGTTTTIAEA